MYLSWGAYYEGSTDENYYNILLPRLLEDIVCRLARTLPITIGDFPSVRAGAYDRSIEAVAKEICEGDLAFDIFFVHADTGGRGLAANIADRCQAFIHAAELLCGFDISKGIPLCPRHETEAWALADPDAVCEAVGFRGDRRTLDLPPTPRAAEAIVDPKLVLDSIVAAAAPNRRRQSSRVLAAIAQRQSLQLLRGMRSFNAFEAVLLTQLAERGFLR